MTAPSQRVAVGPPEALAARRHEHAPSPDPYVSIVLPCFNEQDHVVAEVERICEAMDASGYGYELVAYDDASTDQTLVRLREAASRFPLKVLMPLALTLLGIGIAKGIFDLVVHPLRFAVNTVLIFVTGLIIASLALLADLIVRSRGEG